MQDPGDLPVRAGRPSLLSSAPQAEPEGQRILSSLDVVAAGRGAAVPARAARLRRRGLAWGGGAVAALGAAALAVLLSAAPDGEQAVETAAAAGTATPVLAAAAALAIAAPARPASGEAPSTATSRSAPEPALVNPLADMAPAAAPVSTPAATSRQPGSGAEPAVRHKGGQARPAQAKAREKPLKQRAQSEPDSDVVLLAALMSHMEPRNRKATVAQQLETCKRYNAAGEAQCRTRVCGAAERKEAACRAVRDAGAGPDG